MGNRILIKVGRLFKLQIASSLEMLLCFSSLMLGNILSSNAAVSDLINFNLTSLLPFSYLSRQTTRELQTYRGTCSVKSPDLKTVDCS